MERRLKVLLVSYECSPYRGSEWAVGWGRLVEASRAVETHIITQESNVQALKQAEREGLLPAGIKYYSPVADAALRRWEAQPAIFAYNYTAYQHWQRLTFGLAKELHAKEQFDLVHQVNVCTFREPGYTWQLGIPYVWGPVGGTQNFPLTFLTMLHPVEAVKEFVRAVTNEMSLRFKGRVRAAARKAAKLFAANSTNQRDMERVFQRPVELLLETGLHEVKDPDLSRFRARVEDAKAGRPARPLKLLWSGEFQTRKALPILLRALAKLGDLRWELDVLGDGEMKRSWMAQARRLGLTVVEGPAIEGEDAADGNVVRFLGRLPFPVAVAKMKDAEVFCFTSLRDTSGNVVLEAMAAGVPVVCFDHQGAADMVTETSGVLLPVITPKAAVADWAGTLRELAEDPEYLLRLAEGTTEQARRFLWDANGDRMNAVYRELAEGGVA